MDCSRCGTPLTEHGKFCVACGQPVSEAAAAPVAVPMRRPVAVTILALIKLATAPACLFASTAFFATAHNGAGAVAVLIALLAALCGWGLLTLRPVGRVLQIAFSIVGLLGFPFFTLAAILILFFMFRPGVALLFSRRPAESFSADERAQLSQLQAGGSGLLVAVVVVAVVAVPLMGIIAAIAIPNFLNAVDRGRQKRTMIDLRTISTAIESYTVDRNAYPTATTIDELAPLVEPKYARSLPRRDGWEHPFVVASSPSGYTVFSRGKDGEGEDCTPGVTTRFADEICMSGGQFTRYPEGMQR